jgi:hypothetical protein
MTIKRIERLERLNSSVNGNPRFCIHFDDGTDAITSSDAAFCYGIENPEYHGTDLKVTYSRAGRVADVELAATIHNMTVFRERVRDRVVWLGDDGGEYSADPDDYFNVLDIHEDLGGALGIVDPKRVRVLR